MTYFEIKELEQRIEQMNVIAHAVKSIFKDVGLSYTITSSIMGSMATTPIHCGGFGTMTINDGEDGKAIVNFIDNRLAEMQEKYNKATENFSVDTQTNA